jgi:uncharacterized repeat protein (TIGR01451 family)
LTYLFSETQGPLIYKTSDNHLKVRIGNVEVSTSTSNWVAGEFYHIYLTYNSDVAIREVKLYLDGILAAQNTIAFSYPPGPLPEYAKIGGISHTGSQIFSAHGIIDEVRVYILTQEEEPPADTPLLYLKKTSVIEAPISEGYGGGVSDPVPGATITYTIAYDNDGSEPVSGLIIVDFLPEDLTYIPNSANFTKHIGAGAVTDPDIDFYDSGDNTWKDTEVEVIGKVLGIRWVYSKISSDDVLAQDNSEGTDSESSCDGENPDADAGKVTYKVRIN